MPMDPFGLTGQLLDTKYRVGRMIGEGSFGAVYEGEHTLLRERVAIKCMKAQGEDAEAHAKNVESFLSEARVLFALTHPGIVRLYDVGTFTVDGLPLPYVVLELVDGRPLDQHIQRRARSGGSFSAVEIAQIAEELLGALAYSHAAGVAHRDLKPSNILLTTPSRSRSEPRPAREPQVKIVDFGIACWIDELHRVSSATTFTPAYAAPEQTTRGAMIGARVDVFASALVLAELCTLERVVRARTPAELFASLRSERKIDIRSRRPDLPAELERVLQRAASLDPDARHADARELLDDVRAALAPQLEAAASSPGSDRPLLEPSPESGPESGPDRTPPPLDLGTSSHLGRYELRARLAQGGMGTVYLAVVQGGGVFSKVVVVKRIRRDLLEDGSFALALRDEARVASRVVHANVVQLLDVVSEGDDLGLVFEYVHGATLAELLGNTSAEARPTLAVISAVVHGMLRGLEAAHGATTPDGQPLGLVHRDISPQNVIVGADGMARLLDFGVATARGREVMTQEGLIKGKLGYMAPEQLAANSPTLQADIYAAGVVLWELVTGRRLFGGADTAEIVAARLASFGAPSPLEHAPDLPPALVACIARALAPSLSDRYPSAAAMADALEAAVAPASSKQVSDWVLAARPDVLQKRAELRARVESGARKDDVAPAREDVDARLGAAADTTVTMAATTEKSASPFESRRRSPIWIALPMAIVVVAAVAFALTSRGAVTAAEPDDSAREPAALLPPPTSERAEPSVPPASSVSVAVSASVEARPSAPPAMRKGKPTGPRPAAKPRSGQAPPAPKCVPFTIDEAGNKHWNKECLQRAP